MVGGRRWRCDWGGVGVGPHSGPYGSEAIRSIVVVEIPRPFSFQEFGERKIIRAECPLWRLARALLERARAGLGWAGCAGCLVRLQHVLGLIVRWQPVRLGCGRPRLAESPRSGERGETFRIGKSTL